MANEDRKMAPQRELEDGGDESSSVSSEESEDDDLVLEGALVRNPDVSSSSSSSSSDDDDDDSLPRPAASDKKRKATDETKNGSPTRKQQQQEPAAAAKPQPKKKKKSAEPKGDTTLHVEFTFCDMDAVYFHGLKSLLHGSSTVYQPHSSQLADHMIANVAVGTLISTTEADRIEGNAFGFASVLNVSTYQDSDAMQYLKTLCLKHCPADRKNEMDVVLSGKTKRPAGFLLHARMVNLPLEIVLVLHQQLVLDMDWAVEHAQEAERKSLDFGVFVRLAPCQQEGGSVVYKYFDDEILCGRADFHYEVDAPKAYSQEAKEMVSIIVLTKAGHRAAVDDIAKIVNG